MTGDGAFAKSPSQDRVVIVGGGVIGAACAALFQRLRAGP